LQDYNSAFSNNKQSEFPQYPEGEEMGAGDPKILVVDDQEGVRQLIYEILDREGLQVITAANGYEALELLETIFPVLLLIDMKMPGISGLDVLKEIRNRGYSCLPIMMTAYGELEIIKEAAQLGVIHFINKPFDIDEFSQLIKKVLEEF
jgi:two-component system response regulator (stage 0 sporulation protein F)